MQSLWISKTGLDAQQTRMSVTANNLANANTTGYKSSRAEFADLLYQNVRQVGGQTSENTQLPSGLTLGTGVQVTATAKQFTQGNMVTTDRSLDIAIEGKGFYQIVLPDGNLAYTRDGSFQINDQGQVVTNSGYELDPALIVPPDAQTITIGGDGTVTVQIAGEAEGQQLGQIQLATFINPTGLQAIGDNLFLETGASGGPQQNVPGQNGAGSLRQGFLEGSNVNVVEELVTMIEVQRAYELNSKAISTADQMLQYVNQNL